MKKISKMTFSHIDEINRWFEEVENEIEIISIQILSREICNDYIVFYYKIS